MPWTSSKGAASILSLAATAGRENGDNTKTAGRATTALIERVQLESKLLHLPPWELKGEPCRQPSSAAPMRQNGT
jgi:hypothetical protein